MTTTDPTPLSAAGVAARADAAYSGNSVVMGTLRGYKAFIISHTSGGFRIQSPNRYHEWISGWNESWCKVFFHTPPGNDCKCGFYATYNLNQLFFAPGVIWSFDFYPVLGVVQSTGRIILGTKGVRAQRMKIVALSTVFPEQFPFLAANLPPEIELFNSMNDMYGFYPSEDISNLVDLKT